MKERLVITGMAVATPFGDSLDGLLEAMLSSRSAIAPWRRFDTKNVYVKVGGDMSGFDIAAASAALAPKLPSAVVARMRHVIGRQPWSTQISALLGAEAMLDASAFDLPGDRLACVVGGHNINSNTAFDNVLRFLDEPDFVDPLHGLNGIDSHSASCLSEVLEAHGPVCITGGACASGNLALRSAAHTLLLDEADAVCVVGAVFDWSPLDFHAMAMMGAMSSISFNDDPPRASRPFDTRREGFVPAHGGAAMIVERARDAVARKARIYAELLACEASADATRTSLPSTEHQARVMQRALARSGLQPADIDYVSAHATSTPAGDLSEIEAIKQCFGAHASSLKINAPKSILGHTCWSAALVESVAAILQMRAGRLHQSINIDTLDPAIDLDVCRDGPVNARVRTFLKNAFGFGGINTVSIFRNWEE